MPLEFYWINQSIIRFSFQFSFLFASGNEFYFQIIYISMSMCRLKPIQQCVQWKLSHEGQVIHLHKMYQSNAQSCSFLCYAKWDIKISLHFAAGKYKILMRCASFVPLKNLHFFCFVSSSKRRTKKMFSLHEFDIKS